MKGLISQRHWIQRTPNDQIDRNDVDVRVHRSARRLPGADAVAAKVRNDVLPRADAKQLVETMVTLCIAVLKSRAGLTPVATRAVVQNVEAIRVPAVPRGTRLWVVVTTTLAIGAPRDPLNGLRLLNLDHKTVHVQVLNPDRPDRGLHRATISLVTDYSLRDLRKSPDRKPARPAVAVSDLREQIRSLRS